MSEPNDFDADLMVLLGHCADSPAPTLPRDQESADAAHDLDLMGLLDPSQGATEPVAEALPNHFDAVAVPVLTLPEPIDPDSPLSELARIATCRCELETELLDLYQRLDTARTMLRAGLWAPFLGRTPHGLVQQIESKSWQWRWTETQAWRVTYDAGLIPPVPRPADWSPFHLIDCDRP